LTGAEYQRNLSAASIQEIDHGKKGSSKSTPETRIGTNGATQRQVSR